MQEHAAKVGAKILCKWLLPREGSLVGQHFPDSCVTTTWRLLNTQMALLTPELPSVGLGVGAEGRF